VDGSGRFNFWRVLIYTRAITPPRVMRGLWRQTTQWSWWALLALACLGIGAVLQLGLGDPPSPREAVSGSTLKPAAVQTASPKPPW
jgi:hypothetical protein